MLSFEGKRIDVGANKLKLRRFEIKAFCDKTRSFCTISASTFWKVQPEDGNETLIFKRFASFGHVWTLAIAKVRQNALCCLILIFQRTIWLDFQKGYRRLQAEYPEYPPSPSQTFKSQALIKMATV